MHRSCMHHLLALLFAFLAVSSFAASNVVEITYDNAGNITQLKRQVAAGFAITSFAPTSGPVGTAVTIYGTGFSATPANNTVKFNGTTATVSASDAGSISTSVPSGATTGRITVTVGGSTATSGQDFLVTIPGAPTITSFTPTWGVSGSSVSVAGTNFDVTAGATTVKLNGVTASASVSSTTALTFTVPGAVGSGRISATTSAGTGTSAQDFIVPPAGVDGNDIITAVRIVAGGASANVVVATAGKRGLVLFDAVADTYYTVQFGQLAITPSTATVDYQVIKPDGSVLVTGLRIGGNYRSTINLPKLPSSGTYSILLSPGIATLDTNVKVAADPIVIVDGSAVSAATDSASQNVRFVFDAAAGQRIGLGVTAFTLTPTTTAATSFKAYKPDGTQLGSSDVATCYAAIWWNPQANCDGEIAATVAGTYTLVSEVAFGFAGSFGLQLSSEVTGTLTADAGQTATLARVGQDARYTFSVSAGDSFGFALSGISAQPQAQSFVASIFKPDASLFASVSATQPSGAYLELGTLATAGTYTVTLDPAVGAYGAAHLTLKQGALLLSSDPATAFSPATASESARFRFSGTAGQNLSIGVTGLASNASGTYINVYRPDRTQLSSSATCYPSIASGSCKLTLSNLPVTGVYSIVLIPPAGVTISGAALISADITGVLAAGTPQALSISRAGQNARYTFSGTAGDSTAVKLYGVTTSPTNLTVTLYVYKPDGNYLASTTASSNTAAILNLASLPTTGTYSVLVEPNQGFTWQATLALDPGTLMTIDGSTATLSASSAGESLRYRFAGTAGQRVDFGLTGLTYAVSSSNGTTLYIYKPDGSSLTSLSCLTSGAGACEFSSASLPSTGTYSVVFTPPVASTISGGTFAISTPLAGTLVVGDPAQTIAITRPGQTARYTFSGTAAQLRRLNWSGTTVSSAATVTVTVLKPDASTLSSGSFTNGATGGFDIASLPSTGTYTVVFDPSLAATITAPVTLVTR